MSCSVLSISRGMSEHNTNEHSAAQVNPSKMPSRKSRNPPKDNNGRWTKAEHQRFLDGLKKYGRQWKFVRDRVKTRTVTQVRTHAQKYFAKLQKPGSASNLYRVDGRKQLPSRTVTGAAGKARQVKCNPSANISSIISAHPQNSTNSVQSINSLLMAVNKVHGESSHTQSYSEMSVLSNTLRKELPSFKSISAPCVEVRSAGSSSKPVFREYLLFTLLNPRLRKDLGLISFRLEQYFKSSLNLTESAKSALPIFSLGNVCSVLDSRDCHYETVGDVFFEIRKNILKIESKQIQASLTNLLEQEMSTLSSQFQYTSAHGSQYFQAIRSVDCHSPLHGIGSSIMSDNSHAGLSIKVDGMNEKQPSSTTISPTSRLPSLSSVLPLLNMNKAKNQEGRDARPSFN